MVSYDEEISTATARRLLEIQLDAQRDEIAALLDGLSEAEARAQLVPSLTTVLGLVKHAAFVERVWFHHRVADVPRSELGLPDTIDDSFRLSDADTIESVRQDFASASEASREIAAAHPDLAEQFETRHGPRSLGFIYTHCVQELARHAGHGDILREQLLAARTGG